MPEQTIQLPDYSNPPVIEVVFGIQFRELKGLSTPFLGRFWETLGIDDFPTFKEMPELPHVVEKDNPMHFQDRPEITTYQIPPLPRLFFFDKTQSHLVQLQRDRLLTNWRKTSIESEYPRYRTLYPKFEATYSRFLDFIAHLQIGTVEPDQFELTYVNHIKREGKWENLRNIESVFPGFRCCTNDAFLPEPEKISWRRIYRFPSNEGRLYATVNEAFDAEGNKVYVLNMTARGYKGGSIQEWFNQAHEWIVRGFSDLTDEKIQAELWGKR